MIKNWIRKCIRVSLSVLQTLKKIHFSSLLNKNQFITKSSEKENSFSYCSVNKCSVINNKNKLPFDKCPNISSLLSFAYTNESEILNILKDPDVSKVQMHDGIWMRMLTLSHKSNLEPLMLLFKNFLFALLLPDK